MTHRTPHGRGAKGPTELREQIEQTRHQLGDTIEELVAKVDVKGRASARAADLRDKAGAMTVQLRSSAALAGHAAQERAVKAGHTVQERALKAGHTVQERAGRGGHALQETAGHAGHTVERGVPVRVRAVVQAGMRHPRLVLIAGVAGAALAAGVLWRKGGTEA
ncbi:DUF3618 domain-containing protein [Streptomyces sp. NPDC006739]|uniref:DUF3618 domain-containing protein n=1 Tax=Streptomyces sp. NPDC006739 TaxID=3364763 RepID=UPI00369625E1